MNPRIEENYKQGLLTFSLGLKRPLFEGQSAFQRVEVFESTGHGRVLLNDGCFMVSERDERIYHEMMAHVPLSVLPNAKHVLVIGGGDGGTAREVLRHPNVELCTMVEIDAMVVEACREYLPQTAGVLDDPRLDLKIADGVTYMRDARETFDLILVDSTDPNGAAQPLFGPEFYADVAKRLKPGGVVVAQGESVFYEAEMQSTLLELSAKHFEYRSMFNFTNMTYPGGLWSFMWASNGAHPLNDRRDLNLGEMYYYNAGAHQAAFQLPEFQKRALAPWTKI